MLVLGLDDDALVDGHRHHRILLDILQVIDLLPGVRIAGRQRDQQGRGNNRSENILHNQNLFSCITAVRCAHNSVQN